MAEKQPRIGSISIALGTIGTLKVFWTVQLLPQIHKNWSRKSTAGLSPCMLMLWAIAAVPFGIYAIVKDLNIPVQIQPQAFGFLSLIGWSKLRCLFVFTAIGTSLGTVEAAGALLLRTPEINGVDWPMILLGVIAALLICGGLLPPYFDIMKHNWEVRGLSFIFLIVDMLGAFFSLLSIVFQRGPLDILAAATYIGVLALEFGIFFCQLVFLSKRWAKEQLGEHEEPPPSAEQACSENVFARMEDSEAEQRLKSKQSLSPLRSPVSSSGDDAEMNKNFETELLIKHEKNDCFYGDEFP
ncbi:putative membrane protein [Neolecta irregularis DAH-3]|uniref:Putative membrane protein n=1 Tax=Neolecta irregularis (strain DAH-3) TaxID=1198029 RepID=A0A1U7LQP4_NEOID|nr:putative membrane protein [Neolecta irregularis DAH-3]|eukprot:OLL24948.1 putative membrane protein [Neolecta irregularis DAH-3]